MILKYVQISSVVHLSTSKSSCCDRKSFLIIRWVCLGEAQVNGRRLAAHGLRPTARGWKSYPQETVAARGLEKTPRSSCLLILNHTAIMRIVHYVLKMRRVQVSQIKVYFVSVYKMMKKTVRFRCIVWVVKIWNVKDIFVSDEDCYTEQINRQLLNYVINFRE